jgi:uncharacterized protein with HEPN domain
MSRSSDPALHDILDAIANIDRVLIGKTFHDFEGDWLLRRGVERGIEIISEASRRIPAELRALQPQIPKARHRIDRQYPAAQISFDIDADHLGGRAEELAAAERRRRGHRAAHRR